MAIIEMLSDAGEIFEEPRKSAALVASLLDDMEMEIFALQKPGCLVSWEQALGCAAKLVAALGEGEPIVLANYSRAFGKDPVHELARLYRQLNIFTIQAPVSESNPSSGMNQKSTLKKERRS